MLFSQQAIVIAEDTPPKDPNYNVAVEPGKHDPLSLLNEDLCLRIFNFLYEKPEVVGVSCDVWRKTLFKFYVTLRLVGPVWKELFDQVPWAKYLPPLDVTFSTLRKSNWEIMAQWLSRYKTEIYMLTFLRFPSSPWEVTFQQKLLFTGSQAQSIKVGSLLHHYDETQTVPLGEQKKFQDALARNCPNLQILFLTLTLPSTTPLYHDCISHRLFSHQTIVYLRLELEFAEGGIAIDGNVFSNLIRNLPSLNNLSLGRNRDDETQKAIFKDRRFHVASSSLQYLDTRGLFPGTFLSVDCPQLVRLECECGKKGHGVFPRWPPEIVAYLSTDPDEYIQENEKGEKYLSFVADVLYRFGILDNQRARVADECRFKLFNFDQWLDGESYDEYAERLEQMDKAVWQTFGDSASSDSGSDS